MVQNAVDQFLTGSRQNMHDGHGFLVTQHILPTDLDGSVNTVQNQGNLICQTLFHGAGGGQISGNWETEFPFVVTFGQSFVRGMRFPNVVFDGMKYFVV